MTELGHLLDAADRAGPHDRIEYRDPIAAHGRAAIEPLRGWLANPRVSAFAARTLERIASDAGDRDAAVAALRSVDRADVPETIRRDVSEVLARLGAKTRSAGSSNRASTSRVEPWPGSRNVSPIEQRFHNDMLDIFRLAGEATRKHRPDGTVVRGYWASYFLRGVRNHGGPEYAHQLLRKQGTSEGFQRLKDEGRLDLSVEALVMKPEYTSLFSEEERKIAAHRLAEAGYSPGR